MELQGTIKKLSDTQTFASGFQKREAVILTQEQYPQPINVEFLQEKINLLDNVSEGDNVKIGINLRGREWTSPDGQVKYFNSIVAWSIVKQEAVQPEYSTPAPSPTAKEGKVKPNPENPFADDEEDDLPF